MTVRQPTKKLKLNYLTLKERIKDSKILDTTIIHTIDNPYSEVGGLAILYGNLAQQGAVIKTAGITGARAMTEKPVPAERRRRLGRQLFGLHGPGRAHGGLRRRG